MNNYTYEIFPDAKIDRDSSNELTDLIGEGKNSVTLQVCRTTCDESGKCTAFEYDHDRGCHLFSGKVKTVPKKDSLVYLKQRKMDWWWLWVVLVLLIIGLGVWWCRRRY